MADHFGAPRSTDVLLGVANTTAKVRGSMAFAVLFFGPLASNHAVDQAGFDSLMEMETGEIKFEDATMERATVALYRRPTEVHQHGYNPLRNLTKERLHFPRANDCGSEFVECVPGPCSIWEYDYQFAGLQMSAIGPVEHRLLEPETVIDSNRTNATFTMDEFDARLYYPMVGTVRCGPLFNYQYVENRYSDGRLFDPNAVPPPSKADEFDITGTLTPQTVPQDTLDFLPQALPEDVEVYPVPDQAVVPVPHGVNQNPRWYYSGFKECFNMNTGERLPNGERQQCDEQLILMNWLYNTDPGELVCQGKTPPPYAPANPLTPEDASLPWTPDDPDAEPGRHPDPANLTYTGNPRLQKADVGNLQHKRFVDGGKFDAGGGRAALVGYTRGQEDGYILGDSLDATYRLVDGTNERLKPNRVTLKGHGYKNGKGPNFRITPQELPRDYTPGTCDFTQCRWVPKSLSNDRNRKDLGSEQNRRRLAKPPSAAYAVAASELSVPPPDPLITFDDELHCDKSDTSGSSDCWCNKSESSPIYTQNNHVCKTGRIGNQAFHSYSQDRAFSNKIRAYGHQEIVFRKDMNPQQDWVVDDGLYKYWNHHDISSSSSLDNSSIRGYLVCTTECTQNASCIADGFGGAPCDVSACNASTCPATPTCSNSNPVNCFRHNASEGDGHFERQVCCANYDPFGIVAGGQLVGNFNDVTSPTDVFKDHCMNGGGIDGTDVGKAEVFDVGATPHPTKLGCKNFYVRDSHMEVVSHNADAHDKRVGKCRYTQISRPLTHKKVHSAVGGQRTVPCYGMLGAKFEADASKKQARQAVVKQDKFQEHGQKKALDSTRHHLEWSRVTAINGAGFARYDSRRGKVGHRFDPPAYSPMECVSDQDAYFYELGSVMDYNYFDDIIGQIADNEGSDTGNFVWEGTSSEDAQITFDYRHNFIPTRNSLKHDEANLWKRVPNNVGRDSTDPELDGWGRLFHEKLRKGCKTDGNDCGIDGAFGSKCTIVTYNDHESTSEPRNHDGSVFFDVNDCVANNISEHSQACTDFKNAHPKCSERVPMGGTGTCFNGSNYNSGGTPYKPNSKDSRHCGVLVMMAPFKSRRTVDKYRPLKAYYQETRQAYPESTTSRSAAFLNSDTISDSWACTCDNQDIVWRWLPVPDDNKLVAPTAIRSAIKNTFHAAELVLRSFSWKNPPSINTPDIGLFLPSSQPTVKIAERDFLSDVASDLRDDPSLMADRARIIEDRFSRQDAPRRNELEQMVFQGNFSADKHRAFPDLTFTAGSCLRWPYGQVPRLGLPPNDMNLLYPNPTKTEYGLEATMAYCETISPFRNGRSVGFSPNKNKLQACFRDPLSPRQRHDFCRRNKRAALHVVYGLQINEEKRKLDQICCEETKTCLVVPGRKDLSSLEAVLHAHHKKYRDKPEHGEGYTFLVTPFNTSIFGMLLGERYLAPVAQGIDFPKGGDHIFERVGADVDNITGIREHPDAFSMFNNLNHTKEDVVTTMTALYDDLMRTLSDKHAGCPAGEIRVPARSEHKLDATECVKPANFFKGSGEAGATIHFDGTVIRSAVSKEPLIFEQVRHHLNRCVRITVNGADNVTIGPAIADQTTCDSPATVVVLKKRARFFSMPDLTVVGSNVASAVAVLTASQGSTTDVTGSDINVTFASPPIAAEFGFFRAALAASGAVASNNGSLTLTVSQQNDGNNVVLLPAPGTPDVHIDQGDPDTPLNVIDLRNSIAEFAHGTLKKLYSTDAVGRQAWLTTVILTIVLGTILFLSLAYSIYKDIRTAKT